MNIDNLKHLADKIIQKEKWWDILSRFIDVLRINLFIVDVGGGIILPPEEGRCGGKLLTDATLGFDLLHNSNVSVLKQFHPIGSFLESSNRFELSSFAIPISLSGTTVAYMIVGPVILNKRLSDADYEKMAKEYGIQTTDILHELNEIRAVSHLMMSSILNLLAEIIRDNVELSLKSDDFNRIEKADKDKETNSEQNLSVKKIAQEIYTNVLQDELLVTFLDIALKMTQTECGSIMILDETSQELSIKAFKGLDKEKVHNTKIKIGEGIAGMVAKENKMYLIEGQVSSNNRIAQHLRRPDIKQSLVLPLTSKSGVIGVLNLHTKTSEAKIEDNVENLRYLTQLLSTAF
jgi:putative methionine-R-sulfoxide reductase with GAF domain